MATTASITSSKGEEEDGGMQGRRKSSKVAEIKCDEKKAGSSVRKQVTKT